MPARRRGVSRIHPVRWRLEPRTKEAAVTMQQQIAEDLGVKPEIDPAEEAEARIGFLADYLRATGAKGYVLGISGGQDSTLAGRLAQMAVERARAGGA